MFVLKSTHETELTRLRDESNRLRTMLDDQIKQNSKKTETLQYILAQGTKVPNATVSRILNAATEALRG